MFIVTANIVHPLNRDDIQALPAVESMKKGSLLGVSSVPAPANKTITGNGESGYITEPTAAPEKPVPATTPVVSPKPVTPGAGSKDGKTEASPVKTQTSTDGPSAQEAKVSPDKP